MNLITALMLPIILILSYGSAKADLPSLSKHPTVMALTLCQFKAARDAIREKGKFDDDFFMAAFIFHCSDKITAFKSVGNEPILVLTVLKNFSFIKKKIQTSGIDSFDMYDEFDYNGNIIDKK